MLALTLRKFRRDAAEGMLRITIFNDQTRGDNSKPRLERVVVAGALMRMRLARTYARWPLMKGLLTVFRGFAASGKQM